MFNSEFYPTPREVIESLSLDVLNKIILEPHAGSGNFLDYFKEQGAKQILCCEIDTRLSEIAKTKAQFLKHDFFEVVSEEISHVNMIVMNPPFSNADKHIYHAWDIAPEGCEIISLCNYETILKDYRYTKLSKLISTYGNSFNLGDCFTQAERKTGVEIGLVKLYKPKTSEDADYSDFFLEEEVEEHQENGMMQYNEVRALVNRYVGAMKTFDLLKEQQDYLHHNLKGLGISGISFQLGYNKTVNTKEDFSKLIQKKSWEYIFRKMNIEKYVTKGVMNDINKFVETQTKIPFTMRNIYKMFDIIIGTREHNFNKALEEAIDNFTKHTHENRFAVEGWKTNTGYMLNKKFIADWMFELKWGSKNRVSVRYSSNQDRFSDLTKVLCNLTGRNYSDIKRLDSFVSDLGGLETNVWYSWGFFEIKAFKKGTIHCKFQNEDDWHKLNYAYGKLKGFTLPEK